MMTRIHITAVAFGGLALLAWVPNRSRAEAPPPAVAVDPAPRGVAPSGPVQPAPAPAASPWRLDWARDAVFYEVFVRSFADSDGDGVGDLRGLTAHLDDLNDGKAAGDDLGVDALWLMPVFASPSYHGYDVTDYEAIEPDYGTAEDFDRLLAAAHARGMKVIVDLVLNHTSSQHPWFVEASRDAKSPHHDWYIWRADDPGWTQPWGGTYPTWHRLGDQYYYGVFWGGMPDLDWRRPAVRQEMLRVATAWLRRGVDGFRLDATRHLVEDGGGDAQVDTPETHAALRELAAGVRAVRPDALLVGENWTDTAKIARYFGGPGEATELPMSFDFPLAEAILAGVRAGDPKPIAEVLGAVARLYPAQALDAPFLTNHDQIRLATQLGEDAGRLRLAAAILLTLSGTTFLYYGEEIGLVNGPGRADEEKRAPMPWNATASGFGFTSGEHPWHPFVGDPATVDVERERRDPSSLLAHYRRWIALRHEVAALRRGDLQLLTPTAGGDACLAFVRRGAGESVLVVHNLGDVEARPELALPAGEKPQPLTGPPPDATAASDRWRFTLQPRASAVYRLAAP